MTNIEQEGIQVAVKIIDKTKMDEASTSQIMKEVRCMKLVQHANIVRLYEVLDTQTKIFLILELGDYDLHDFIIKHEKGVSETLAQQYFCQIMTAIDYCHQLHVVHRDLKPENVVFFEKLGMVKLTDFGFSNSYEPGEQLSTSCGSLAYSAPEILLGDSYDAPAVDVWSLGVILYMLVCGRLPFQEANDSETLTKILDCKYSIPDVLSTECKNLIQSMLVREPQKRASLDKIVASLWVQAGDRGLSTAIPLIVRHHLPPSAHTTIIEQMVAGGIASEDTILRFLENDDYNSVTATYYLLAERVLSSYREEQARELLAKHVECEDRAQEVSENPGGNPRNINSRCRSRSNSWRARPCSILKEESEEELSSYLRSASRQSSSSALFENDRPTTFFIPTAAASIPTTPTSTVNRFDDVLSPIDEREGSESDVRKYTRRSDLSEIVDDSLSGTDEHAIRKSSDSVLHAHHQLLRSASAKRLLRRNSSPSVSMFACIARDRVSPQAVQELLDLNRLGGARGRAASPESVRSSRSPSPPASSSGRTSPAMSTISSMSRLKVSSANVTNSGMRKLSSSPHLLGICEETEEGSEVSQTTSSRHLRALDDRGGRTNRSASTGVVHIPSRHHSIQATKSSAASLLTTPFSTKNQVISSTSNSSTSSTYVQFTPNTYSAARSIRPRQAIVSPDVLRRYDPHQRLMVRSKRSASCSSSDASDDDDGRRLTMLSSKCASKFDEQNKKDDDDEANGGMTGKRGTGGSGTSTITGGTKQSNSQTGMTTQSNEKRSTLNDSMLPLRPIPEMALLDQTIDADNGISIRNRILHTSLSTQSMIRQWTEMDTESVGDFSRWYGTPTRDYEERRSVAGEKIEKTPWLRQLHRAASSHDLIRETDEKSNNEDSGCSSTENSPPIIQNMYNHSKFSFLHTLPMEKVDRWLQCAEFVF
uniref:Protein kinase domain-containing protein n=1 Tax=Caenorhabditis japonica TaxID=281687 RepID=A0A8R1HXG9_CAEJA